MIRKYNKILLYCFLLAFGVFFVNACASISAPTGGPRDEKPPKPVSYSPKNYSINFKSKTIEIVFDEYVELKDLQKNLIISPPLEEMPDVRVRGMSVIIEIYEELSDSTTYNLYFGNSIRDFTESNPIENFQYVFSTGTFIDSMAIKGNVYDAFNLVPSEDVFVMLYSNLRDSVPMQNIPEYISKTNEEGYFEINNIRNNKFKLFCLADGNSDYLYNQNTENIAFIDSLVTFNKTMLETRDTVYNKILDTKMRNVEDSIRYIVDSTSIDTVIVSYNEGFKISEYNMFLFNENKKNQYIKENKRLDLEKIQLVFNDKIRDSISVNLLDSIDVNDWYIVEENETQDTFVYWLSDSSVYNREEINIEVEYYKKDSLNKWQLNADTLKMRYFSSEKEKDEEKKEEYLSLKFNIKNSSKLDLNKTLSIISYSPISDIDTSKIDLFTIEDSVKIFHNFVLSKDSNKYRQYIIDFIPKAKVKYNLQLLPSAFTDIYNNSNDTINLNFSMQDLEYYGKVITNILGVDSSNVIVQLLKDNEDENLVREKFISNDCSISFEYLYPGEYILKFIKDKNNNFKWTTGDYLKSKQPEEVFYKNEKIEVRSNWDLEIDFDFKK